jgi:hypothetical protein
VLGSRLSGKGTRPSYQIFQGTVLQWRRCVRPCTSARPLVAKGGGSAAIWPYFLSAPNADSHVFLNRVGHVVGHIDKSDLKIVS